MNPFIAYLLSYCAVILIGFALIQYLSNGFLFTFMRVKGSRGKLLLVIVKGKIQHYCVTGKVIGGDLIYRDAAAKKAGRKVEKSLTLPDGVVFRIFNVNAVMVDEEKNCILRPGMHDVPGFDPIKWGNYLKRALLAPKIKDDSILLVLVLVGLLIVLCICIYLAVKMGSLNTSMQGLRYMLSNASISVGVPA